MSRRFFRLMEQAGDVPVSGTGDVDARLAAPEGQFVEPVAPEPPADPDAPDGGTPPAFTPSPMWDVVGDVDGFVRPEAITAETEMEQLKPFLAKKFGFEVPAPVVLDPITQKVQDYLTAKPGSTFEDVVKDLSMQTINYKGMSDEDLIRTNLFEKYGRYDETTAPDGLSDEDVDEELRNMGKIAKKNQASMIRESYEAKNTALEVERQQTLQAQVEEAYTQKVQEVENISKILLADLSKNNELSSLNISQTDLPRIMDEFKDFALPNKETGLSKLNEWLSNDQNIFSTWLLAVKYGQPGLKELITREKESTKENIFNILKITPSLQGNQGQRINVNDPLMIEKALSSPDGSLK